MFNSKGNKDGLFKKDFRNLYGMDNDLLNANVINNQTSFTVELDDNVLYKYRPDCICENENKNEIYVIELKRASKYEPLGIAEVIHHTVHLRDIFKNKTVIPVLISSFNMWNRTVINELNNNSINNYVKIRYYEVYILSKQKRNNRNYSEISNEEIVWFYDPFIKDGRSYLKVTEDATELNGSSKLTYKYDKNQNEEHYTLDI